MAIAFDAATSSSGSGTSATYLHTVGSISNGILWTTVGFYDASGTDRVDDVANNGVSMTRLASVRPTFANAYQIYLYYLFGPATGSHNTVITFNGSAVGWYSTTGSYSGAAQSGTPDVATSSASDVANITVTPTVTVANSWAISTVVDGQHGDPTRGTGLNATRGTGTFEAVLADSNGTVSAGAYGMTWVSKMSPTADSDFSVIGAAFAPAASGPTNVKTYNTNVIANIKTINTNVIANVKTLDTNT